MGEYAKYRGEDIKMGTCEDMYYLRFDQRKLVTTLSGGLNPCGPEQYEIRFRFPFPDEDKTEPGCFDPYGRAIPVPGNNDLIDIPDDVDHHQIQFVAQAGYNVCLPCPESMGNGLDFHGAKIHRNGFPGRVLFDQQKLLRNGDLALICRCGGCGSKYRIEDWSEAEPIVVACRSEADRRERSYSSEWWHAVADRISAGYSASGFVR